MIDLHTRALRNHISAQLHYLFWTDDQGRWNCLESFNLRELGDRRRELIQAGIRPGIGVRKAGWRPPASAGALAAFARMAGATR